MCLSNIWETHVYTGTWQRWTKGVYIVLEHMSLSRTSHEHITQMNKHMTETHHTDTSHRHITQMSKHMTETHDRDTSQRHITQTHHTDTWHRHMTEVNTKYAPPPHVRVWQFGTHFATPKSTSFLYRNHDAFSIWHTTWLIQYMVWCAWINTWHLWSIQDMSYCATDSSRHAKMHVFSLQKTWRIHYMTCLD